MDSRELRAVKGSWLWTEPLWIAFVRIQVANLLATRQFNVDKLA